MKKKAKKAGRPAIWVPVGVVHRVINANKDGIATSVASKKFYMNTETGDFKCTRAGTKVKPGARNPVEFNISDVSVVPKGPGQYDLRVGNFPLMSAVAELAYDRGLIAIQVTHVKYEQRARRAVVVV